MIEGFEAGGGFSLIEHPMLPQALAAPTHRHSREDEYSFVLEGEVSALLGDEVLIGKPGDLIFKRVPGRQFGSNGNSVVTRLQLGRFGEAIEHLPEICESAC